VGEHHAEFVLFKDFEPSPSTLPCCGCEVLDSNEPMSMLDMTLNDLSSFDCTLFEGSGLDGVMVDSLPPSIIKDRPDDVDEGYVSDSCRCITLMMSMPPMSGGVHELDLDFELEFGSFDGDGRRMTVLLDPSLWRTFMFMKDLNPKILRWILLMHSLTSRSAIKDKGCMV